MSGLTIVAVVSAVAGSALAAPLSSSIGSHNVLAGDPVGVCSGNVTKTVVDRDGSGAHPLSFVRTYNSLALPVQGTMGAGWHHGYERRLQIKRDAIDAYRPEGNVPTFRKTNGMWFSDGKAYGFEKRADKYVLTERDGSRETYDADGQLESIGWPDGHKQKFRYKDGWLRTITDSAGDRLRFTYGKYGLLESFTGKNGKTTRFTYLRNMPYDGPSWIMNSLATVTYAERRAEFGSKITYRYGFKFDDGFGLDTFLNSVFDEEGRKMSQWTFNRSGQALSSKAYADPGPTTFEYDNKRFRTTVTDATGSQIVYQCAPGNDVVGIVSRRKVALRRSL